MGFLTAVMWRSAAGVIVSEPLGHQGPKGPLGTADVSLPLPRPSAPQADFGQTTGRFFTFLAGPVHRPAVWSDPSLVTINDPNTKTAS